MGSNPAVSCMQQQWVSPFHHELRSKSQYLNSNNLIFYLHPTPPPIWCQVSGFTWSTLSIILTSSMTYSTIIIGTVSVIISLVLLWRFRFFWYFSVCALWKFEAWVKEAHLVQKVSWGGLACVKRTSFSGVTNIIIILILICILIPIPIPIPIPFFPILCINY